jgi:hypothetical protein
MEKVKQLGAVYKQLNAPFGVRVNTLLAPTTLTGDDATYLQIEAALLT